MTDRDSSDREVLLAEQAAYYRARADEYDEWWQRKGRYDHGTTARQHWHDEVAVVEGALDVFAPTGRVLELACGTGWWTERLARYSATLTCVDASREVIAINRARMAAVAHAPAHYVEADLFEWQPQEAYDVVFFSFWLSHVPPERFGEFWKTVAQALRPGGRVFLVDSSRETTSGARGQHEPTEAGLQERRLNDGRIFQIVKVFYEPDSLVARLGALGWRAEMRKTERYFIYGNATRP